MRERQYESEALEVATRSDFGEYLRNAFNKKELNLHICGISYGYGDGNTVKSGDVVGTHHLLRC